MTDKIDLGKLFKNDYIAPKKPVLVQIPEATYLAIEGQGAPGGSEYQARIGALCAMAYTIKMTRKFGGEQDYTISKLEAQWWADKGEAFWQVPQDRWCWKLFIRTPDFVQQAELEKAAATLRKKGKAPEAQDVELHSFTEGKCVQMLHVGPYEREGETVAIMRSFAESKGLRFHGLHHEIYISDPRRVPPERLKTILREPVK